jgi:cyclic pyranopterin phosphate synthase
MPEENYVWLEKKELLDFEELALLVDAFCAAGVKRVRITGGEPLVRRDLHALVALLAKRDLEDLALTSNGLLLAEQVEALARAGLGRLTVSLDTLRPDRFEALTRRDQLAEVLAGIEAARRAGLGEGLKLDAVVLRGFNDDELVDLLGYAAEVGAELRFIEYMDVGGATRWSQDAVVSRAEMLAILAERLGTPVEPIGGRGSAPAERFRLPDGRVFGIIASTTTPFCASCDRSRVTADGMWFHCLYATRGIDLRSLVRGGATLEDLTSHIAKHWRARADRGAEMRANLAAREPLVPISALRRDPHLEMHTRGG